MCKSSINQISVNCLSITSEEDLSNTLRSFWKMDSNIVKDRLSQDDKNCFTCLDSVAVYMERKYDVPMLWQEEENGYLFSRHEGNVK